MLRQTGYGRRVALDAGASEARAVIGIASSDSGSGSGSALR